MIRVNALLLPYLKALKEGSPASSANELRRPFERLLTKGLVKQGSALTFRYFHRLAQSSLRSPIASGFQDLRACPESPPRRRLLSQESERYDLTLLRHALALGVEVFTRVAALAPRSKIQVTLCFDEFRGKIAVFSFHTTGEGQECWPGHESFRGQPTLTLESA